ncbi:Imm8 family immunity protein [Asaia sp. HN128]|uniref:Imm8 family immunity protein n=1 Tax=Asaia sp. HN128 TaxID=3081234 RepID=UPI0030183BEB
MKSVLIKVYENGSNDLLEDFIPNDKKNFDTGLTLIIGAEGEIFEQIFYLGLRSFNDSQSYKNVCGFFWERFTLFIESYEYSIVFDIIRNKFDGVEGTNWRSIEEYMEKFAISEFSNYIE